RHFLHCHFYIIMMKLILVLLVFSVSAATAQELYVYTEPASNMAAKSFGFRLTNYLMDEQNSNKINYKMVPEVMWGASKRIMVHVAAILGNSNRDDGFVSDPKQNFVAEGGSFYLKYRFYSTDEVQTHFRVAAFGKYSINNSHIHEYAINLGSNNSGYEGGLIATKLMKKVALSASGSFLHAQDNGIEKFLFGNKSRNAVDYTLSVGKLMLPKDYTGYKQTNLNLMLEMLGQTNLNKGYSYLDIAPSIQFIFLSRMRFDAGYRYPLVTKLPRTSTKGFLLRLEYNIFNAY
ncbi:MAG: hypothetical protein ABIN74_11390, partial [Ferruginibacter sp.]